ncbi:unnamed protein product [Amoebophrya sp. A25]|nr:unnamed protein product [Amoebophrya sp. A25]|eukprot:GSA25T00006762001.1
MVVGRIRLLTTCSFPVLLAVFQSYAVKLDPFHIDEITVSPVPVTNKAEIDAQVAEKEEEKDAALAQNWILDTAIAVEKDRTKVEALKGELESATREAHSIYLENREAIQKVVDAASAVGHYERRLQLEVAEPLAAKIKKQQEEATLKAIRADRDDLGKAAAKVRAQVLADRQSQRDAAKQAEEDAVKPIAAAKGEEARSVVDFWNRARSMAKQVGALKKASIRVAKQAELYSFRHLTLQASQMMMQAHELMKQADALRADAQKFAHAAEQMNGKVGTIAAAEASARAAAREQFFPGGSGVAHDEPLPDLPSGVEFAEVEGGGGSAPAGSKAPAN